MTSTEAASILTNIENGKWGQVNNKMVNIGNQLGLRI
jgi:hypothetical protein